jgi:hypothetical protein
MSFSILGSLFYLKMETAFFSETPVSIEKNSRRHVPEENNRQASCTIEESVKFRNKLRICGE